MLVALTACAAIAPCVRAADPFAALRITKPPQPRAEAPNFKLRSLKGGSVSLSDFRGKLVLLNFWATFCLPCREEMTALQKLWNRYHSSGLVVLAVAEDRGRVTEVESFVDQNSLTFPVLLDPDGTARKAYDVNALPITYLVGPDGKIRGRAIGSRDWSGAKGRALIDKLLRARGK